MTFCVIIGRRAFAISIGVDRRTDCCWLVRDIIIGYAFGKVIE